MMKTCLFIAFALFSIWPTMANAQLLTPVLISPCGNLSTSSSGSLSWTLGETAVDHVQGANDWLTQGFQQSDSLTVQDTTIKINPGIPNSFTPNDDGFNDVFDPLAAMRLLNLPVGENKDSKLFIFNRWGEVVFKAEPYETWNGRNFEQALPQGTYYFLLETPNSGRQQRIKGPVMLILN